MGSFTSERLEAIGVSDIPTAVRPRFRVIGNPTPFLLARFAASFFSKLAGARTTFVDSISSSNLGFFLRRVSALNPGINTERLERKELILRR